MERLNDDSGHLLAEYAQVMNTVCIRCKLQVTPSDGMFMALGAPYHGVLHRWCAPFYVFNGAWPHPMPAQCYSTRPVV